MKRLFTIGIALSVVSFLVVVNATPARAADIFTEQNSGVTDSLRSVYFLDRNTGIVVGANGTILRTIDGGTTWVRQNSGSTVLLKRVYFMNGSTGWAVGYNGTILKTVDGGITWLSQASDLTTTVHLVGVGGSVATLQDIKFFNNNNGIAVGGAENGPTGRGTIFKTTDGGTTWAIQSFDQIRNFSSVSFSDSMTGWLAGEDQNSQGIIWKTINGGATWSAQTSPTTEPLYGVQFIDSTTGWIMGLTNIWRTTNGGASWNSGRTNASWRSDQSYLTLRDIRLTASKFLNSQLGYAVSFGSWYKTTDGGVTWSIAGCCGAISFYMSDISFSDANTGWIVGGLGHIYKFQGTLTGPFSVTRTTLNTEHVPIFTWPLATDNAGIAGYDVKLDSGSFTDVGNVLSWTGSALSDGSHTISVRARNTLGAVGSPVLLTFTISTPSSTPPPIPSEHIAPTGIFFILEGSYTNRRNITLTNITCNDNVACTQMRFSNDYIHWSAWQPFAASSGWALPTEAIPNGQVHVYGQFQDAAGNISTEALSVIYIDTIAPTIGIITPATATAGVDQIFSISYSDNQSGVATCSFSFNNIFTPATLSNSGLSGTATAHYTFPLAGSSLIIVRCFDSAGNWTDSSMRAMVSMPIPSSSASSSVTVGSDTAPPRIGVPLSPLSTGVGISTTFTLTVNDETSVDSCELFLDGISQGVMDIVSSHNNELDVRKILTFTQSGTHRLQPKCQDRLGNTGFLPESAIVILPVPVVQPLASNLSPAADQNTLPSVLERPLVTPRVIRALISNPDNLNEILSNLSLSRKEEDETRYKALVQSDAAIFKVELAPAQETAVANFVVYGISEKTKQLGAGERRAVVRDYLETVGRGSVNWDDVERMTRGEKPVARNLEKERAQVPSALQIFEKIYNHAPNFQDHEQDLAWNTLLYRIRFSRNLSAEQEGIKEFKSTFGRVPVKPLDWATVRALGYVVH